MQSPPEHAAFYSERLQLLPVSAFRGEGEGSEAVLEGDAKSAQRRALGLPAPPAFITANLNRPFKLEPKIFQTWLAILARSGAPGSGWRKAEPGGRRWAQDPVSTVTLTVPKTSLWRATRAAGARGST